MDLKKVTCNINNYIQNNTPEQVKNDAKNIFSKVDTYENIFGAVLTTKGLGAISKIGTATEIDATVTSGASDAEVLNVENQVKPINIAPKIISNPLVKSNVMQTEIAFEGTFEYASGETIDLLADRAVVGNRLELTNIAFYPTDAVGNTAANSFGNQAISNTLEALKDQARSQGFKELRVQFERSAGSSSAKPGKIFDQTFKLEE